VALFVLLLGEQPAEDFADSAKVAAFGTDRGYPEHLTNLVHEGIGGRGEKNDRALRRDLLDTLDYFEAIAVRQTHFHQHHVRSKPEEQLQRAGSSVGLAGQIEALLLVKDRAQMSAHRRRIVRDQDRET